MGAASIPDAVTAVHPVDTLPPSPSQEVLVDVEETLESSGETMLEGDDVTETPARINSFPHHLIGTGGVDEHQRYVVPSAMAIGPYRHGLPHLQEMEEEHLAAHSLTQGTLQGEPLRVLHNTNERLEARMSMTHTRIHRFPHRLRGIGGADNRYIVPSVVAIGPYHHGQPHLQQMEEVKRAAAYRLLQGLRCTVEEAYEKILSVAGDARRCYDDASPLIAGLRDAEFADMMFVDGCFLLWYLTSNHFDDPLLQWCNHSSGPSFLKDIFLLENQIPWLVMDALMEFANLNMRMQLFVLGQGTVLSPTTEKKIRWRWMQWGCILNRRIDESREATGANDDMENYNRANYKPEPPPHLLALLRFVLICNMPTEKRESQLRLGNNFPSLSIGAIELVQSGVKLTASASTAMSRCFADMKCQKKKPFFFGELSLSPLFLDDVRGSWLVNMAALESAEVTSPARGDMDGYVVSSYLSMLAMLMDREEDVHELRRSGVLNSSFSNAQTLAFFKCLGQHLRLGYNYFNTLGEIDDYMRRRPLRTALHRFVYNNYKIIIAFMSVIGVLASILRALYSLKEHLEARS